VSLTWTEELPPGTTGGGCWGARAERKPEVAIAQQQANRKWARSWGRPSRLRCQASQFAATVVALDQGQWAACVFAAELRCRAGLRASGGGGGRACAAGAGGRVASARCRGIQVTVINVAQALTGARW